MKTILSAREAIVREPLQKSRNGDAQFQPGQRRAQTIVHAMAERDMPVRIARNVDVVGPLRIARDRGWLRRS